MVMRGPLILIEPLVWIRRMSKNRLADPDVQKRGRARPTRPRSLPELIKINDSMSWTVGRLASL